MFDPNCETLFEKKNVGFSHRSDKFKTILIELENIFKTKFGLPEDSIVLFITGSGTLVNEIVLSSMKPHSIFLNVDDEKEKFGIRLKNQALKYEVQTKASLISGQVQYETSISKEYRICSSTIFVDAISSFPFYKVPSWVECFTTVGGKQLGSYAGIGIIVIQNRDFLERLRIINESRRTSYLNIFEHINSCYYHETPYTPSICLVYDLLRKISAFDIEKHRKKIFDRRDSLEYIIPKEFIIGVGPVLSLRKDLFISCHIPVIYDLYETKELFQIFLWSGSNKQYEQFGKDIKNHLKRRNS